MAIEHTPRLGLTQWTDPELLDPVHPDQFNADAAALDNLAAIAMQGTAAERPAFGVRGRLYYATDTGDLTYDTGTAWVPVGITDHGELTGLGDNDHPQYVLGNQDTVQAGEDASAAGSSSVVLGRYAAAEGSSSVALGRDVWVPGNYSVALGREAAAEGSSSVALGYGAWAEGNYSVALGYGAWAASDYQGVLGVSSGSNGPRDWLVPGTFSVTGTKNFEIPHPDDPARTVRHGSYEGPVPGGTVYRYRLTVDTDGGQATQRLPDYFATLNADVDVHVSPVGHFGRAFGEVVGDMLTITGETAGEYAVLILGTRDDPAARTSWELYQDVRPAGVTWSGDTSTIEVEEPIALSTIERVVKQYRAPEGDETKITAAHFVGRVIDVTSDDGTPERIRIGPDELPERAQGAQVARLARDRAAGQAAKRDLATPPSRTGG